MAVHGDCNLPWRVWSTLGITVVPVFQWVKESKDKSRGFRKDSFLSTSRAPLDSFLWGHRQRAERINLPPALNLRRGSTYSE